MRYAPRGGHAAENGRTLRNNTRGAAQHSAFPTARPPPESGAAFLLRTFFGIKRHGFLMTRHGANARPFFMVPPHGGKAHRRRNVMSSRPPTSSDIDAPQAAPHAQGKTFPLQTVFPGYPFPAPKHDLHLFLPSAGQAALPWAPYQGLRSFPPTHGRHDPYPAASGKLSSLLQPRSYDVP